jgi:glyoxylase-like metal-dependent hydrolase (beta-lactamase superfamily II)
MRNYKAQFVMAVLAVIVVLFGCSKKNDEQSVSENAIVAMGGSTALHAVTTQQITASGQLFEPEQTLSPNDPPRTVSSLQYTLTEDLSAGSFRYDWTRGVTYPFEDNLAYSEVINGNQGFVTGQDTANAAAVRAALPPVRLATLTKLHRLTSPLVLMRAASDAPQTVEARQDEQFNGKAHHVIALPGSVSPVRLFIDPDTFLPAKADTMEDDPLYGNTLFEVIYTDWRRAGEIMVPFHLTQNISGLGKTITIQTEERTAVQNNVQLQAGMLDIPPDLQAAYDPADGLRGERMSQLFLRRQALGLPSYVDQSLTVVFTESSPGSGIWHVTGGSHNSLVVVMADHVIVVEPPLYEARSQAVIAGIKSRFPGKPISDIIVTHFHFDHSGGVRAYAAEGAGVVVGAASQAHFQAVMAAPHTVVPDALQNNPRQVTVTAVPAAGLTLTDGVRTVGVYPVQNTHAADMVIAHVSGENLVFVSDLFSPPSATVAAASIPQPISAVFSQFSLSVNKIAGGHGAMADVQQ